MCTKKHFHKRLDFFPRNLDWKLARKKKSPLNKASSYPSSSPYMCTRTEQRGIEYKRQIGH